MSSLSILRKLFWVSRPISWPNTSYPFAVGFLLTSSAALTGQTLLTLLIGTLYFVGPYNLLMYGINDIFDYESDIRNPRKGGVEGMKESRRFHPTIFKAILITNIPFLIYLLAVSNWQARIVLLLVVFAAVAYSLKGLRFKEIPFLDSITSSFHFVGPLLFALALTGFPETAWPWVAAFFVWGMASHALGAVQDIIPDREGGLQSIATALGARATVWFSALLYLLATCLAFTQGLHYWPVVLTGLCYVINCLPYLWIHDKTSARTNMAWRRFLWLNYLSGAVVTFVIIFNVQ
jgi:4-hydroxybenzoate polyprenyltransferase and related prenyltransferases